MTLQRLAYTLFCLTRREIWLGGCSQRANDPWPKTIKRAWNSGVFWTLSPEVELGGHRVRVCVTTGWRDSNAIPWVRVLVYVDDEIKHPGGSYDEAGPVYIASVLWRENWACRIAAQEREDGGRTGPVDRRDLLIEEAEQRLRGPARVEHDKVDEKAIAAAREVEALVGKVERATRKEKA